MPAKLLSFLALATATLGQLCPIQFEGRVPANTTPASFDASTSLFNPTFVFGANLTWSKIIQLPNVPASLFDEKKKTKAIEVTISDASIFAPSASDVQTGFRRAELLPASNNGSDPSTLGIKTLHFSIRKDNARPLNVSHEYQLAFVESADFSTNQFVLKTGTIIGAAAGQDPNLLVLQSNVKAPTNFFTVPFAKDVCTTQVLYSINCQPLRNMTARLPNDISGRGQFHFGILKKPTGDNLTDITKQGFQPAGINEGVVYGGIFEEDSVGSCVSLRP